MLPPPAKRVKVFTADGREGLEGPHAWALNIGNREPAQRPVRVPDGEAAEATDRASVQVGSPHAPHAVDVRLQLLEKLAKLTRMPDEGPCINCTDDSLPFPCDSIVLPVCEGAVAFRDPE